MTSLPLRRPHREPKYPFPTMGIGDTFTIPAEVAPQYVAFNNYVCQRNRIFKPKRFACFLNPNGDITVTRKS
jgi:hypothetical protein